MNRLGLSLLVASLFACYGQNRPAAASSLEIDQKNASLLETLASRPDLETLTIHCLENLRALPDSIAKLPKLKALVIDNGNGCTMNARLPEALGDLHSLEKLVLFGAQDPRGSGPQPKERQKFPASISQLQSLTYLDLGRNGLTQMPDFVKDFPHLRELRFGWNQLKVLPAFIANLREIKTLSLEGNDLEDLPDFLTSLPKLTSVSLGNNCKITQSPLKKKRLQSRFPRVTFDFEDEYDCPAK